MSNDLEGYRINIEGVVFSEVDRSNSRRRYVSHIESRGGFTVAVEVTPDPSNETFFDEPMFEPMFEPIIPRPSKLSVGSVISTEGQLHYRMGLNHWVVIEHHGERSISLLAVDRHCSLKGYKVVLDASETADGD